MDTEISVIMSVFNTKEEYLREAVESILNQTFKKYEFIIINDCSDEKTTKILEEYQDQRIVLIKNDKNLGLTASLNLGLAKAKGRYIARMDSDDISYVDRFERQYNYMEQHPNVDVLGGWVMVGKKINKSYGSAGNEWRKVRMLFENAGICHSTAFIRKTFLDKYNIKYDVSIKKSQDYDLWCRCLETGTIAVMPKKILEYRVHESQISVINSDEQMYYKNIIRKRELDKICQNYTERELEQFLDMRNEILSSKELDAFWRKILKGNREKGVLNDRSLKYELSKQWMRVLLGIYKRKNRKSYLSQWLGVLVSPCFWCFFITNHIQRRV